jgi:hypothetical protein
MRKVIAVCSVIGLFSFLGALSVSAAGTPACDGAIHGAFVGVNGSGSTGNYSWLGPDGGASDFGSSVGQDPGATGSNNSNAATYCQSL